MYKAGQSTAEQDICKRKKHILTAGNLRSVSLQLTRVSSLCERREMHKSTENQERAEQLRALRVLHPLTGHRSTSLASLSSVSLLSTDLIQVTRKPWQTQGTLSTFNLANK